MIPLYGFLQGDTMGLLVLAEEGDTMDALAGKLQALADVRVAKVAGGRVVYNGRTMDRKATVSAVGMEALDRFDVRTTAEAAQ
jgi:hypothetical protein